jgi:hypothetical protein
VNCQYGARRFNMGTDPSQSGHQQVFNSCGYRPNPPLLQANNQSRGLASPAPSVIPPWTTRSWLTSVPQRRWTDRDLNVGAIIARSPVLATDKKASLIAENAGTDVAKAVVDGFGWHVKPLPGLDRFSARAATASSTLRLTGNATSGLPSRPFARSRGFGTVQA